MIKTGNFTTLENVDLSKEIALVGATDTPLVTFLMRKGLMDTANSVTINWREKTLDNTDDISVTEGSETTTFQSSTRAEKNNVCEIFKKAAQVSGTAQASDVQGISNLFASEINDRLLETKINLEKKILAEANYNDGSIDPFVRRMKSLYELMDENNFVRGSFTKESFIYTVKLLWDAGVISNNFYCFTNADYKETIDGLFANQVQYNAPVDTFGFVCNRVITNYGNVNVVLDRHVPEDKIIIVAPEYLKLSFLRKPQFEPLAKNGDYISGQVLQEVSIKLYNSKACSIFETA